ncbi:heterokaryon incompatibility protein-domain-containing protein, partial [Lophiotrema nucula]
MLRHNSKIYQPLPDPERGATTRVLRIHAGRRRERMLCSLVPAPIADTEYEALSYAWGTSLVPHKIIVDGAPFYVTSNLYSALYELRQMERDRIIWIDAVCINQSDNIEKSTQVQMMRSIYSKASKTIVWLG